MTRTLKILLGIACLITGIPLALGSGAAAVLAVTTSAGVSLFHLLGIAAGLALIGTSAELFGFARRRARSNANGIAHSIWATEEHLDRFNVLED